VSKPVDTTLPAISLADGPFVRVDTGDQPLVFCSATDAWTRQFGIPSGVPMGADPCYRGS